MSSLESRLAALETQLGVGSNQPPQSPQPQPQPQPQEIASRLDQLQASMERNTTVGLRDAWFESLQLLRELDPDIALTHQQQPLLYKRQQVLAAARNLESDMQQLDVLLKLLTTATKEETATTAAAAVIVAAGTPSSAATTTTTTTTTPTTTKTTTTTPTMLRLDQVIQAPIVTLPLYDPSPVQEQRLDALRLRLQELTQRIAVLHQEFQTMLECYHSCMAAASSKCILAQETIMSSKQ
jgi:hypothetical protein